VNNKLPESQTPAASSEKQTWTTPVLEILASAEEIEAGLSGVGMDFSFYAS
jgi:hypothetical protein